MNRKLAVSLVALALLPASALAAQAPADHRAATGQRELAGGVVLQPVAPHRWRASSEPPSARAWSSFTAQMGPAWATWSDGHPRQIIGAGIPAPGVVASPAEAERVARELLVRHLDLLAPGTDPDDFVLVSNHESAGVRSVGFQQQSAGRDVVGGQIGLSFEHDRLVMITSLAQPQVLAPLGAARVDDAAARDRARRFIHDDFAPVALRTPGAVKGPLVLPVGDAGTGPRYREVVRVEVESEAPLGRWWVYLDAQTGEPVARESRMHYASGRVFYNVPERSPIFTRSNRAATFTQHVVDGAPQVSDIVGFVTFTGASASVEPGLFGPLVEILDEVGPLATGSLVLSDGAGAVWSQATNELFDAQLSTFVHTGYIKGYVNNLAPDLAWLDGTVSATVNIADECNAMSDGDSLYFLQSSDFCENTGRMSDVIYHEFGHSVHNQSLIPGVGSFDGALSEGISDYLAATVVGDSGVGRGFFFTDEPLRELDPEGFEWTWPQDNGEVHDAGRIIGGTLWDLRTLLIAKYGQQEGVRRTDRLWYEATRRAVDMPSMYGAALVVDDDDGNLANGTPDGCEINAAFGAHGLFASNAETAERVTATEREDGLLVHLDLALPSFEGCPLEASARVEWGERDGGATEAGPMVPTEGGFEALLPRLPDGQVMVYRSVVDYSIGAQRVVPSNLGDPWFEHWFGPVEPIYCTSFEEGSAADWELSGPWEVSPPMGLGGDPAAPAGGDPFVLGLDLSGNGLYEPWSSEIAVSPVIPIPPGYESIRLHYQRWLTVEDGFYDQASILVNGQRAWNNYASTVDFEATTHHRDAQWVFHDVDLTPWAAVDGEVVLGFDVSSDGGLEMGGWTIDELCVMGYRGGALPAECGNGRIDPGEECDDGDLIPGDGCSEACRTEGHGGDDGVGDDGGDFPDGDDGGVPDLDGDGDGLVGRGCGCRARQGDGIPAGLGLLVLLMLGWRRRVA